MRVCKDDGITIFGKPSHGLYIVQGNTVIGDVIGSSFLDLDIVDESFDEIMGVLL